MASKSERELWMAYFLGFVAGVTTSAIVAAGTYIYLTTYLKGLIILWLPKF